MHARHQSPSARSADGVDIVIVKDDPGVGQRVNVGGGDLVGAVEPYIVPALGLLVMTRNFLKSFNK